MKYMHTHVDDLLNRLMIDRSIDRGKAIIFILCKETKARRPIVGKQAKGGVLEWVGGWYYLQVGVKIEFF